MTPAERPMLWSAAADAEEKLHRYVAGLAPRPDRKSGHKVTKADLVRWRQETKKHAELLAEYRAAVALLFPPVPCGEPRPDDCNCTWGTTHVCNRKHGHDRIEKPIGGHCCRCGVAVAVGSREVRRPHPLKAQEVAA